MRPPPFDHAMNAIGKRCRRCLMFKPFDDFSPDPTGRGDRQSQCKACCVTKHLARRARDPEKTHLARQREYQRALENGKAAQDRAYYDAHLDQILARTFTWREGRREIIREQNRQWRFTHRKHFYAICHSRRMKLQNPTWSDQKALNKIYINCPPNKTVDHIVPLKGRTIEGYQVTGLHVPWNLQYLTDAENKRKCNRMRPEDEPVWLGAEGYHRPQAARKSGPLPSIISS